eukprot:COSAG02_NODE_144_length_34086_cov_65.390944_42_plen_121_part_01
MGCNVSTPTSAPLATESAESIPTSADEPQIVVAAEQPPSTVATEQLVTVAVVPAEATPAPAPAAPSTEPPALEVHASYLRSDFDPNVEKWGKSVFEQFDTDKDGGLSVKELTRALKSLPRT